MEMIRAPRRTTVPRGMSRGTWIVTSTRCGSYAGCLESESARALRRFCTESARALKLSLFSESARIESVRCFMRSSESATAKSHFRKERPIDQYACRPSLVQPAKSPPIIVSRLVGNAADDGSDTLTTGVCPPMNGSVTS